MPSLTMRCDFCRKGTEKSVEDKFSYVRICPGCMKLANAAFARKGNVEHIHFSNVTPLDQK